MMVFISYRNCNKNMLCILILLLLISQSLSSNPNLQSSRTINDSLPAAQSSPSKNECSAIETESATMVLMDHVFNLFRTELIIQHFNLIVYAWNESSVANIQNYIRQHQEFRELLSSTIIIAHDESDSIVNGSLDSSFKNVLASSIQSFYTDIKTIFFIQPTNVEDIKDILEEISSFYKKKPEKSFSKYFFITWPLLETELIYQKEDGRLKMLTILKSSVLTAPLDSHLYILLPHQVNFKSDQTLPSWNNGSGQGKTFAGSILIFEFYYVYEKIIFEPIKISGLEFIQLASRRGDFKGTTVKALVPTTNISTNYVPSEFITEISHVATVMQPMSEMLNFKLTFLIGGKYIGLDENGSLTGMGKQLLDHDADVALSLYELLIFRLEQLAPAHSTMEQKINAYFKQPPPGLYRDILFKAFTGELWALMGATWILIVTCLIVFTTISKKYGQISDADEELMTIWDSIAWAIATACQTGWHWTPSSTYLKITLLCGLISGFIYYTAYSASIISIFSVELNKFQTLTELDQNGFKFYGHDYCFTGQYYVEHQANLTGESLESRIIDETTALKKIQESRTAYVISREYFFFKAVYSNNPYDEFCGFLSKLPRPFGRQHNAWYFRKHDPLRKFIDTELTRWKERGLMFRTNMELFRRLPSPCDPKKKEAIPLEFLDVQSAFFILAAGIFLSVSVLAVEKMIRQGHQKNGLITCRRHSV